MMKKEVLDYLFGNTSPASVGNHYYALFKQMPTEAGPIPGSEVTGGSYARQQVVNNGSNYTSILVGQKEKNLNVAGGGLSFPEATANWGTVVAIAIMDAPTGGNMIAAVPLATPQTINIGDVFRIPNGTSGVRLVIS